MPEDKEGSAVTALLNEINSLRQRLDALEMYLGVGRTNTARCGSYTSLNGYPDIGQSIRDFVSYRGNYEDDTIYAVTEDGTNVPIFTPTNSNVEPRTFTVCRSANR